MTAALVTLWRLNSWAKMRYSFHKLLFSLTIEPGPLLGCGVAVWGGKRRSPSCEPLGVSNRAL